MKFDLMPDFQAYGEAGVRRQPRPFQDMPAYGEFGGRQMQSKREMREAMDCALSAPVGETRWAGPVQQVTRAPAGSVSRDFGPAYGEQGAHLVQSKWAMREALGCALGAPVGRELGDRGEPRALRREEDRPEVVQAELSREEDERDWGSDDTGNETPCCEIWGGDHCESPDFAACGGLSASMRRSIPSYVVARYEDSVELREGGAGGVYDQKDEEIVRTAWACLLDNLDVLDWVVCSIFRYHFGTGYTFEPHDLVDWLRKAESGNRKVAVYFDHLAPGSATLQCYSGSAILPYYKWYRMTNNIWWSTGTPHIHVCRKSKDWVYIREYWSRDEDHRVCVATYLASIFAHELCHYHLADPYHKDECSEIYAIENTLRWTLMLRYPGARRAKCCKSLGKDKWWANESNARLLSNCYEAFYYEHPPHQVEYHPRDEVEHEPPKTF